ncbi:MAG: CPBP family intramembrane glutamic endopeptidase [Gammaproteobacteria bacterium]
MIRRYPLPAYFLLAYLCTWAIEVPMLIAVRGGAGMHLPLALEALAGFGPFAAALIVLAATRGRAGVMALLASLCRWRVPLRWYLFALASPFAVLLAALLMTGQVEQLRSGALLHEVIAGGRLLEMVLLGGLLRGIGEEPGWRGFALPELRGRFGPLAATLVLFPFWLLWHLPSFLMRPEFQWSAWLGFSAGILSAAIWCTLLYDATRSVLMAALWHALINICRGLALTASTAAFLAFGQIVLVCALVIVAYWLLRPPGRYRVD